MQLNLRLFTVFYTFNCSSAIITCFIYNLTLNNHAAVARRDFQLLTILIRIYYLVYNKNIGFNMTIMEYKLKLGFEMNLKMSEGYREKQNITFYI